MGSFVEGPRDSHVPLRQALLTGQAPLAPASCAPIVWSAASASDGAAMLKARASAVGYALAHIEGEFDDDALLALARRLGRPNVEHDAAVLPFTSRRVILNVRATSRPTDDVALQPFSTGALSMHTESSRRPLAGQPRYLLFSCCHPGGAHTAAQTVLLPMAEVAARLDADSRRVLRRLRYGGVPGAAPILRERKGQSIFSFRDFETQSLAWVYDSAEDDDEDVGRAAVASSLRSLLHSLYSAPATAVSWQAGLLLLIDNRQVFHGRTAAGQELEAPFRHLKRVRLL